MPCTKTASFLCCPNLLRQIFDPGSACPFLPRLQNKSDQCCGPWQELSCHPIFWLIGAFFGLNLGNFCHCRVLLWRAKSISSHSCKFFVSLFFLRNDVMHISPACQFHIIPWQCQKNFVSISASPSLKHFHFSVSRTPRKMESEKLSDSSARTETQLNTRWNPRFRILF